MTPTDKHKCIVEQWIYGLKVHGMGCFDPDAEETYVMKIVDMDITDNNLRAIVIIHDDIYGDEDTSYLSVEEEISPILRPLSDLTKEITHKGYNDDQPFVPSKILDLESCNEDYGYVFDCGDDHKMAVMPTYFISETDKLHLWHFDTRNLISQDGAIDVNTLDINPYSV